MVSSNELFARIPLENRRWDTDDLEDLATQLAERHAGQLATSERFGPAATHLASLSEYQAILRQVYEQFQELTEAEGILSGAGEWILDNFHLVQQAIRQIQQNMPADYYHRLPKLEATSLQGFPRIYDLILALVGRTAGQLNVDQLRTFVRAYQQTSPLTLGELWALPTMLRWGVIQLLSHAAVRAVEDLVEGSSEDSSSSHADVPLSSSPHARGNGRTPDAETLVANCLRSLQLLETQDWKVFFEAVSRVEDILRADPAGVYERMDFDTRNQYRETVEYLARHADENEEAVAQAALELAREAPQEQEQEKEKEHLAPVNHVGFYLLDVGRRELEERLDYRSSWTMRLRRWMFDHPLPVYLGTVGMLVILILVGGTAYLRAGGGKLLQWAGGAVLGLVPAWTVAVNLVNGLITHITSPRVLPKLDFSDGVPDTCKTMVVMPTLLSDADEVDDLLQQIELHYLGNADPNLHFALLTDFTDAPQETMPGDEALIEQARQGIHDLNHRYHRETPGPFYLFHRRRLWNEAEDRWMGWERKRGKLMEFNRLLQGDEETSYVVQQGDLDVLPDLRYVITLDADTALSRDSARRLIATLHHPLNQPRFAPASDRVVAGYTVLQPRVEIEPVVANRSLFTRIFAGDVGVDLYTRAVSDVYQDFFGEGLYMGKGIYDLAAFQRSLEGRAPENALLSHDLFEGIQGRAGLVTDIVLYEDYPPDYLTYAHRMHRWVRGDWQILPWLFPRVPHAGEGKIESDLSALDRWKIFDNLRRSLHAPAQLAFLVLGWFWLPSSPWLWTSIALFVSAMPFFSGVVTGLARKLFWDQAADGGLGSLRLEGARWLFSLIFLPYEAVLMFDAIVTTGVRMFVSHKRLLQWKTTAHTIRLFGVETKLQLIWSRMRSAPVVAVAVGVLLGLLRPVALPVAVPFLLAWLISPWIAHWISRPIVREPTSLSEAQRRQLRCLARRTWLYFERFVGPEDHWLPPDHFQEDPRGVVAHRTSPTNIGLALLSTLASYEFGYVGLLDLTIRLRSAYESMSQLERYRGHFLNWYDTQSLKPLAPRYVSTVDSGNLVASLWALRQGILDLEHQPILHTRRWEGFLDTLDVLGEVLDDVESAASLREEVAALRENLAEVRERVATDRHQPERWPSLLAGLSQEGWRQIDRALLDLAESGVGVLDAGVLQDLRLWSEEIHYHLSNIQEELNMLMPWLSLLRKPPELFTRPDAPDALQEAWVTFLEALPPAPRLDELATLCRDGKDCLTRLQDVLVMEVGSAETRPPSSPPLAGGIRGGAAKEAHAWCERMADALDEARLAASTVLIGLQDLAAQAEKYAAAMDFRFLFDEQREVFYLGWQVEAGELDKSHYDMLASEARIASVVAIAKGDIPQRHWLHLNRPLSQIDGRRVLLSWNGSMFEYLMPDLLIRNYEDTLLFQTDQGAVECQIDYARRVTLPSGDASPYSSSRAVGIPWGISESGYYRFDANKNYQYRGFGVPGLGRKRGLGENLVIAPYASLIALSVAPQAVAENVRHLMEEGVLGHYGFYEAVDYTSSRMPMGQQRAIVRSYMVHHQGMILLALANYLADAAIVRRFHGDPRVQSIERLLQEQVPHRAPVEELPEETVGVQRRDDLGVDLRPWDVPGDTPVPHVHLLSNGRYNVLITSAGGGYSTYTPQSEPVALTRWRADTTLDDWGTWIYIYDGESGDLWSATQQPTGVAPVDMQVRFHVHRAEFWRRNHGIASTLDIVVNPDDDVEVRRLTLTNRGDRRRWLGLTSYGELVMASQNTDRQHPAFNKLFIESERLTDLNGLLFRRRPRSSEESSLHVIHLLLVEPGDDVEVTGTHESDRARFLGRGRTFRSPVALLSHQHKKGDEGEKWLSGATDATLDPIMALGQVVELPPHATARVAYVTLAAESRDGALALARRYHNWSRIDETLDHARDCGAAALRNLGLEVADLARIQKLLSVLVYPHAAMRGAAQSLVKNRQGQAGLWSFGISGDFPILLVKISEEKQIGLVRELLRAHAYWRSRHSSIDLVIVNQKDVGYAQELNGQLQSLMTQTENDAWLNRRGGIFILKAHQMSRADRLLLETAARAVLDGEKGRLGDQLPALDRRPARLPRFVPSPPLRGEDVSAIDMETLHRPDDLQFDNGLGGFTPDGREYVIYLEPASRADRSPPHAASRSTIGGIRGGATWPPAPWINVIANPDFGFLVSEAGGGYTWAGNSGENRLTPWRNDPVTDMPGEALYLRDEQTAAVWSPTPLPAREDAPYLVRHGPGYTVFEHHSHDLRQELRLFAAPDAPVKVIQLRLENTRDEPRRITATYYAEWVLGTQRDRAQQYVVPEYEVETQALLARNTYNAEFGQRVAFLAASQQPHSLTADRTEFLGREGSYHLPAALGRVGLEGEVRPGLDPCAAIQVHLDLEPGETREIFFLLGQGADREDALNLIREYRARVADVWEATAAFWDDFLGTVAVETPDPAMDLLLNCWLPYQALACRLWARSALYQSSGAYGFRDQLQDVMSLVHAAPELAREHILRAARHQFEAGDVLHWWHPPSGRGVRTRISDDLLWLPYVTAEYVNATGDAAILDERVPFRRGEPLAEDEEERYGHFDLTDEAYTLYEHCCRALEHGKTSGPRGLPLLGAGDWNDGMNRVGIEGRGESVWLGWFLHTALTRFVDLCEDGRMSEERARRYRQWARELREALADHAWDGEWYRRAYYDDGTPLGSEQNDECQIDSLAQSWAVLSGVANEERMKQAMAAVDDRLIRSDERLILLFTPPFDETPHDPGYIKGYPPGIRENGGQYTHAALWVVWAFAELGDGDRAEALFRLLNPIYHADTPEDVARYAVEPYVIAPDVYSAEAHVGHGGWTWYTGSSGWMYRLGIEAILGLRRAGDVLHVNPRIPRDWSGYAMTYRYGETVYQIKVDNQAETGRGIGRGVVEVTVDGQTLPYAGEQGIPLEDDGQTHEVRVVMGEVEEDNG